MSKVFISYARKDKDEVYPIVDELERNGFDCWIDKEGIESGSVFKKVIISAINECEVFVYMFSKNAFDSEWVDKEYDHARAKKKHIIPVMLKGAAKNEDIMFDFRRIDYIDTCKDGWKEKLINNLEKHVSANVKKGKRGKSEIINRNEKSSSPFGNIEEDEPYYDPNDYINEYPIFGSKSKSQTSGKEGYSYSQTYTTTKGSAVKFNAEDIDPIFGNKVFSNKSSQNYYDEDIDPVFGSKGKFKG